MTDEAAENRRRWLERKLTNARKAAAERSRPKVGVPTVGLAVYFAKPVGAGRDPAKEDALARLLVDPRWPWQPWWASYSAADAREDRPSVRVGGSKGHAALAEGIGNPRLWTLWMNRTMGDNNVATVMLDLRGVRADRVSKLLITSRTSELPVGKSFDAFLTLLHELVVTVEAEHAILGAWPTYAMARSDTGLTRMLLDTPAGDINLGLPLDFDAQRALVAEHSDRVGHAYARHPRWGTYLHAGHLAAIGGVEKIVAEVAPAVIQPIGALTYVQLTDSIDTALTPEAGAKRRALEALMAPILVGAPSLRTVQATTR